MRLIVIGAGIGVAALALTGCTPGSGGGGGQTVDGATFTLGLSADPGNLDPQLSAATALFQVTQFAYDNLLSIEDDGSIGTGLATKWSVDGTAVSLTLHDGVTCSDGTPFTAEDAAANITWVSDPANLSPFLGTFLPAGASATASDATHLVITLAAPAPFVLNGLGNLPMVCGTALTDRTQLASGTLGTGPYVLSDAAPGDQYTYKLRDDYTWGPDGVTSKTAGLPAKVVIRIITNETTAANLLLSGDLNAATVIGADTDRLEGAGLFTSDTTAILGEMWFNQSEGRAGADQDVRIAFTRAVDLGEVAKVLTSGKGGPGTGLAVSPPVACPGDSVSGALPKFDAKAAAALLDGAGWVMGSDGVRTKDGKPLDVVFSYDTGSGAGGSAAAELVTQAWTKLGAKVEVKPQDENALVGTLFGSGDWDIAWVPLNVSSPDQALSFTSGPPTPDGSNFAHIDNPEFLAKVDKASKLAGTDGCPTWLDAESELVADADVIPFANQDAQYFGNGAKFRTPGAVFPTSIRMLKK